MCTALKFEGLFGRNLDLHCSYGEQVCILPRRAPMEFRKMGRMETHYAMVGMALVMEGVPLWYDAANEKGLAMAGLNFPGNAYYFPAAEGKENVAPSEFIPWVLGQCATLEEARGLLGRLNLTDMPEFPQSPLHWMISDESGSIVAESTAEGLHIYENPVNVLTNNPPYPYQLFNLNNYRNLNRATPENRFSEELNLDVYCQGLGALGLPGDVSSMSRFVRMAFNAGNATKEDALTQFFHLLDSVQMIRGCCRTDAGEWDITVYSSCIDMKQGKYYYTTYGNRQISCVDLGRENLDGDALRVFPLQLEQRINCQN